MLCPESFLAPKNPILAFASSFPWHVLFPYLEFFSFGWLRPFDNRLNGRLKSRKALELLGWIGDLLSSYEIFLKFLSYDALTCWLISCWIYWLWISSIFSSNLNSYNCFNLLEFGLKGCEDCSITSGMTLGSLFFLCSCILMTDDPYQSLPSRFLLIDVSIVLSGLSSLIELVSYLREYWYMPELFVLVLSWMVIWSSELKLFFIDLIQKKVSRGSEVE